MNSIGPLIVDIAGTTLTQEDKEIIKHPLVGGIILFSRNYQNPTQIQKLIAELRAERNPLFISVDQEGGRVQRFKEGFKHYPPLHTYGQLYDTDPKAAIYKTQQTGYELAKELIDFGIDLTYAPVVDLYNPTSKVIGDRAFHHDPTVIALLAKAWVSGMAQAGMAACIKHFPGHGSVSEDSHLECPSDPRTFKDIQQKDIAAFNPLLQHKRTGVMLAHIIYPDFDEKLPVFSTKWINYLRNTCRFTGPILSDDLSMAGAKIIPQIEKRVESALNAGCDWILICNDRPAVKKALTLTLKTQGSETKRKMLFMDKTAC